MGGCGCVMLDSTFVWYTCTRKHHIILHPPVPSLDALVWPNKTVSSHSPWLNLLFSNFSVCNVWMDSRITICASVIENRHYEDHIFLYKSRKCWTCRGCGFGRHFVQGWYIVLGERLRLAAAWRCSGAAQRFRRLRYAGTGGDSEQRLITRQQPHLYLTACDRISKQAQSNSCLLQPWTDSLSAWTLFSFSAHRELFNLLSVSS